MRTSTGDDEQGARHRALGLPPARSVVAGLAALAAAALLLAACGDDGGDGARYGPELRARFVEDCSAQGDDEDVCGCFYDRLAAEVPFDRFREIDRRIRNGDTDVPADIVDQAAACDADPGSASTSPPST